MKHTNSNIKSLNSYCFQPCGCIVNSMEFSKFYVRYNVKKKQDSCKYHQLNMTDPLELIYQLQDKKLYKRQYYV